MATDPQLSLPLRLPRPKRPLSSGILDKSGCYRVVMSFNGAVEWGDWALGWQRNRVPEGTLLTIKAGHIVGTYWAFDSADRFVAMIFASVFERCLLPINPQEKTDHD